MEAPDEHIIASTGNHSGKAKISLNLAIAMVREQDFESVKAACGAASGYWENWRIWTIRDYL